ncbi:MAG: hypothetical protein WEB63_00165 [Cucumibacter sp.]
MPDPTLIVVLIAAAVIFFGGLYIVYQKQSSGWGPRNIQALGLVLVLPTILILAGMGKIENAVIATLLGAVIGFILGGRMTNKED